MFYSNKAIAKDAGSCYILSQMGAGSFRTRVMWLVSLMGPKTWEKQGDKK